MKNRKIDKTIPDVLRLKLRDMGADIAAARKIRKLTQSELAERINVARMTIVRMERGDHRVSFGAIASAAWVMGLEERLLDTFNPERDPVFQREARLDLPRRVGGRRNDKNEGLDF